MNLPFVKKNPFFSTKTNEKVKNGEFFQAVAKKGEKQQIGPGRVAAAVRAVRVAAVI